MSYSRQKKLSALPLFLFGAAALVWNFPAAVPLPDNVKAVLQAKCAYCHKSGHAPDGLILEPENALGLLVGVPSRGVPSLKRIDPASPEKSYLLKKIQGTGDIDGKPMPPPGKPALTPEEMQNLQNWVKGFKKPNP